MKKEDIIVMVTDIFNCENVIITGTYSLSQYFYVEEEDIHDIDFLIPNNEIGKEKIKAMKNLFPLIKEEKYITSPSYTFNILGEKINIVLKKGIEFQEIKQLKTNIINMSEHNVCLFQKPASILHTKAQYSRDKDFYFFEKYEYHVKRILKEEIEEKFHINI